MSLFGSHRLANKSDQPDAMSEYELTEMMDLEEIVNVNKIPTKVQVSAVGLSCLVQILFYYSGSWVVKPAIKVLQLVQSNQMKKKNA